MIIKDSRTLKGTNSKTAKNETNDCVVKAIASSTNVHYDIAHEWTKKNMKRKKGKGVNGMWLMDVLGSYDKKPLEIGKKKFRVKELKGKHITNEYKLYGGYVQRDKTVKSFIKDHPKGTYFVTVSKHAFTVKDGVLIDNKGNEFRPTRKVTGAYEFISNNDIGKQLKLDFNSPKRF